MDPKEFYSLSHEGQIAWKEENEITVTGIEFLQTALSSPYFKNQMIENLIAWFLISFISCLIMSAWVKKTNDS